jgi:uncharacterized protein
MRKEIFEDGSFFFQILFICFVALVSLLVFFLVGILFALPFSHWNAGELLSSLNNMNDPASIGVLKYFQSLQTVGLFIVPPVFIALLFSSDGIKLLSVRKKPDTRAIVISSWLILASIPCINYLAEVNSQMHFPSIFSGLELKMKAMETEADQLTTIFVRADSLGILMVNLFVIALLPAVGEELMFRGLLQRLFSRWTKNAHWGIFIAAFTFSFIHFQFYGFIARLVLGMLLGYMLYWSGSIWVPITAHFVNNGFAVVIAFLEQRKLVPTGLENIGSAPNTHFYIVLSVVLSIALMFFLYKRQRILERNAG